VAEREKLKDVVESVKKMIQHLENKKKQQNPRSQVVKIEVNWSYNKPACPLPFSHGQWSYHILVVGPEEALSQMEFGIWEEQCEITRVGSSPGNMRQIKGAKISDLTIGKTANQDLARAFTFTFTREDDSPTVKATLFAREGWMFKSGENMVSETRNPNAESQQLYVYTVTFETVLQRALSSSTGPDESLIEVERY
jgi:hypothetical protein